MSGMASTSRAAAAPPREFSMGRLAADAKFALQWLYVSGYLWEWVTALGLFGFVFVFEHFTPIRERRLPLLETGQKDPTYNYPVVYDEIVPAWALVFIMYAVPLAIAAAAECKRGSWLSFHHVMLSVWQATMVALACKRVVSVVVGRRRPCWYERMRLHWKEDSAAMSYPSGHAAYSMAAMTVMALYLAAKLEVGSARRLQTLRLLGALVPIYIAVFTAISRTMDYVHDFSDINAGMALGMVAGLCGFSLNFHSPVGKLAGVPKTREPSQPEYRQLEDEVIQ